MDAASQRRGGRLRDLLGVLGGGALDCAYEHARDAYPDECCGFILTSGPRRCVNVQDRLHREDPAVFPRAARYGFILSADDQLFLMNSLRGPERVLAIYHSHIDTDACFSQVDRAGLMTEGRVAYPELFHLVIACQARIITGAKLFECDGEDFRPVVSFPGSAV